MIINGFSNPIHHPVVYNILETFKASYCHIINSNFEIDIPPFVQTTFHDAAKLALGDYDVDWNDIQPLDEELIESMSDCEAVALRMMDRHLHIPLYNDRKRLYLKHLRYWNHVLNENKIDIFLSSAPPHEVYDFILYSLCKMKKIPTISLFQIMDSDVIIMMDNWQDIDLEIKRKYQYLLRYFKSVPEAKIKLSGGLKDDFEYQLSRKDATPRYKLIKHKKGIVDVLRLFSFGLSRLFFLAKKPFLLLDKILHYIKRSLIKKYMFNFYNKNTTRPNMKNRFIYFPLHMQPEATTSPLAGAFVDQILVVQMIVSFLPKNIYLYIKEHPSQTDFSRDIEFYKELLRIPQVRLVPMSTNTFDLINNSIAIATATGTAGWEALYRRKPVLLFGHCFYQYAEGVFMIRTNNDCKKALNKTIKEHFKPSIKSIKIYLKALENYTIEGYIDPIYQEISHTTDLISNENIIAKLTNKINSVYSKA